MAEVPKAPLLQLKNGPVSNGISKCAESANFPRILGSTKSEAIQVRVAISGKRHYWEKKSNKNIEIHIAPLLLSFDFKL